MVFAKLFSKRKQSKPSTMKRTTNDAPSQPADLRSLIKDENKKHQVVIWVKSFCPYCEASKDLMLKTFKGSLDVKVHNLSNSPDSSLIQDELLKMTGQRTVPNIFIRGNHVGGNSELQELYHSDALESLLFPDISKDDTKFRAIFKGVVVAESDETIRVVLSYYFPPSSLKRDYFQTSSHTSFCGTKGEASYYTVAVVSGNKKHKNTAWTYQDPHAEVQHIKGYVSFSDGIGIWKGLEVL